MQPEHIERSATITAIKGSEVNLTVLYPSACSHYEVTGHYYALEGRLETITPDHSQLPSDIALDDQVSLEMRSLLGMRAALLTMVAPTLPIIAVTILLSYLEADALAQILIALDVTAAYAFLL